MFVPHIGCPHRCSFCDQRAITGQQKAPTPQDVRDAAEAGLRTLGAAAREAQIAFFGGSFTAIAPDYRRSLLKAAYPFVKSGQYAGIRLSTRPDAIDGEILDELRAFGVTAIELGAQSMDDAVLRQNGRGHTAEATRAAAQKIRDAGFSLGLQMMTGLFCDTDAGARRTAEEFAALLPREVRIYPALVLRGTALCDRYARGEYRPQTLEGAVALCTDLLTFFERRGITVIRLGLHETPALDASFVAGPRHPAFGELCRARQYRLAVERAMRGRAVCGSGRRIAQRPLDCRRAAPPKRGGPAGGRASGALFSRRGARARVVCADRRARAAAAVSRRAGCGRLKTAAARYLKRLIKDFMKRFM